MTKGELANIAEAVAESVIKKLRNEMVVNDARHLTPREYAAKARIQESKVYEAIKTGKLIALPSELGTSNVRRWKIPQWAIQKFEEEQHRLIIDSEIKSSNAIPRRTNRAPSVFRAR
ncbi:hypothetical protein [Lacunimicrobium album]